MGILMTMDDTTLRFVVDADNFKIEVKRYEAEKQYRDRVRSRLAVSSKTRSAAIASVFEVMESEWVQLCRGGQFSTTRFRWAVIFIIAERKATSAGVPY